MKEAVDLDLTPEDSEIKIIIQVNLAHMSDSLETYLEQRTSEWQKTNRKLSPNKHLADSCYHTGSIGVKDLLQAERVTIKFIQWQAYEDEIKTLLSCGTAFVKVSSNIHKLDPLEH